jgi:hypothetical protein
MAGDLMESLRNGTRNLSIQRRCSHISRERRNIDWLRGRLLRIIRDGLKH